MLILLIHTDVPLVDVEHTKSTHKRAHTQIGEIAVVCGKKMSFKQKMQKLIVALKVIISMRFLSEI